jgi:cobalt-precorrin 5A hydrolase
VPVEYYSAEELDRVVGVASPSAVVQRWVGTRGVCEPAALLSSGATALLVPKHKAQNATMAVARVDFTSRRRS